MKRFFFVSTNFKVWLFEDTNQIFEKENFGEKMFWEYRFFSGLEKSILQWWIIFFLFHLIDLIEFFHLFIQSILLYTWKEWKWWTVSFDLYRRDRRIFVWTEILYLFYFQDAQEYKSFSIISRIFSIFGHQYRKHDYTSD